uniref:Uncharacterized protein n=1 Tax=Amphimedon queenslandica TaxID=400682 RepID=A0A1X7VFG6_AMPQE
MVNFNLANGYQNTNSPNLIPFKISRYTVCTMLQVGTS